jgi:hypothetical protein
MNYMDIQGLGNQLGSQILTGRLTNNTQTHQRVSIAGGPILWSSKRQTTVSM